MISQHPLHEKARLTWRKVSVVRQPCHRQQRWRIPKLFTSLIVMLPNEFSALKSQKHVPSVGKRLKKRHPVCCQVLAKCHAPSYQLLMLLALFWFDRHLVTSCSKYEHSLLTILPLTLLCSFYSNSADLHIGVTDSKGQVFEYDSQGVKKSLGKKRWDQCLAIPISPQNPDDRWIQHWDYTLAITAGMDTWSASDYQEDGINCYSFVLTFLKMLHVPQLKPSLSSKQQFCSDFMVSRTVVAAKYISLYRQVIRDGASVISAKNNNNCKIDVNDHHCQKQSNPTLSGVTEMSTVTITHPWFSIVHPRLWL